MKPHRRHLLAAAVIAAAGFGALAQAQSPAAPGPGARPDAARMEQFRARMQQRMAERLGEWRAIREAVGRYLAERTIKLECLD